MSEKGWTVRPPVERLPVGVVVEKRASRSRWAAEIWKPVAVFPGGGRGEAWREMRSGEGWTQYYAGTAELELHRSAAEDYKRNLSSPRPAVYVVLTPASGVVPWRLHSASLSPYDGEAYMVADDLVEAVSMPDELAALVSEFAEAHFRPEKFRKRQRDQAPALVEEAFGKQPIFSRPPRTTEDRDG